MENIYRKKINIKQVYKEKDFYFEPDSSPVAWDYYKLVYKKSFGDRYQIETPVFCEYLGYNKGPQNGNKYYNYCNKAQYSANRLYALMYGCAEYVKSGITYYCPDLRLGGEVDFNFNSKHAPYFEWLLSMVEDDNRRALLMKELEKCIEMHHTVINFSVMQVVGNLQGFKGCCCEDRVDKFIFFLKLYYDSDKNKRDNTSIARYATNHNRKGLIDYLDSFDSVYEYCLKIYLIEDEEFVNQLIENGKKKIETADDVARYIELAKEFWDRKEKFIEEKLCT